MDLERLRHPGARLQQHARLRHAVDRRVVRRAVGLVVVVGRQRSAQASSFVVSSFFIFSHNCCACARRAGAAPLTFKSTVDAGCPDENDIEEALKKNYVGHVTLIK